MQQASYQVQTMFRKRTQSTVYFVQFDDGERVVLAVSPQRKRWELYTVDTRRVREMYAFAPDSASLKGMFYLIADLLAAEKQALKPVQNKLWEMD